MSLNVYRQLAHLMDVNALEVGAFDHDDSSSLGQNLSSRIASATIAFKISDRRSRNKFSMQDYGPLKVLFNVLYIAMTKNIIFTCQFCKESTSPQLFIFKLPSVNFHIPKGCVMMDAFQDEKSENCLLQCPNNRT